MPSIAKCWELYEQRFRIRQFELAAQQRYQAGEMPGFIHLGVAVDGKHVVAVWVATRQAVERVRNGEEPTSMEAKTYRLVGHHEGEKGNRDHRDRVLGGRIEKLLILGRAMTAEEVRALFETRNLDR